jgi:hypothetical protein
VALGAEARLVELESDYIGDPREVGVVCQQRRNMPLGERGDHAIDQSRAVQDLLHSGHPPGDEP